MRGRGDAVLAAGTAVGEIEHTSNGVQTAAEQLTL